MRKNNKDNSMMYSLKEHKQKIISNIQDFLNYKRTNSIDFGSRLMHDFQVIDFVGSQEDDSLMVKFEGYEGMPHSNHYWVEKVELEAFLNGKKLIGVNLIVDKFYQENNCIVLDVNLMKNGVKKTTIYDAEKLKGIKINYLGKIYKSYDVQVQLEKDTTIDKVIRVFVFELSSAESYINNHTVVQNKIEIKNGITFEDFESQEQFVRKFDALEAIRLERKAVSNEFKAWFLLNMEFRMDAPVAKAILDKLKEIV